MMEEWRKEPDLPLAAHGWLVFLLLLGRLKQLLPEEKKNRMTEEVA